MKHVVPLIDEFSHLRWGLRFKSFQRRPCSHVGCFAKSPFIESGEGYFGEDGGEQTTDSYTNLFQQNFIYANPIYFNEILVDVRLNEFLWDKLENTLTLELIKLYWTIVR